MGLFALCSTASQPLAILDRPEIIQLLRGKNSAMKAHVWVMLKSTVLDPQGQTIQKALSSLGYEKVQDVRQGKFFVLQLNGLSRDEAKSQVERIAKDVLTNPVIEEFRFE